MAAGMGDGVRLKTAGNEKYSDLVDSLTIDLGTRSIIAGENTITVASTNKDKRDMQVEAVIEIIMMIKKSRELEPNSNVNRSCGLVLKPTAVSLGSKKTDNAEDFIKVGKVLGKGNSAGEVILVRDKVTEKELAYKTILISEFNGDEIRAWVHLADEQMAPELYHFRLIGGKVEFSMEPLSGQTMNEVVDKWVLINQGGPQMTEKFSLCVLFDLLGILEELSVRKFTHGDMHSGNIMLEKSMTVKLIDYGRARVMLCVDPAVTAQTVVNDVVGIIRIFCALYSGVDFNDLFDAKRQLRANDLSQLSANMCHLPKDSRKELFKIMSMLFDTVRRDPKQEGFGDTSQVAAYVKTCLPLDVMEFKKKVAVILFPEKFQIQTDSGNSQTGQTVCDGIDSGDYDVLTWNSSDMIEFVKNVTPEELQMLEDVSFFWK